MSNLDDMIEEADRLLEENNFAAALDLYRAAIMMAPPTKYVLDNLRVAEEQEVLQFSLSLTEKYPDSLVAAKNYIDSLLRVGGHWNAHAVTQCTKLLKRMDLDATEERRLRRLRFHAATRTSYYAMRDPYQSLVEDFSTVWQAGDTYPWAIRSRDGMLEDLLAMKESEAIPVLEELAGLEWLPSEVSQLLGVKVTELRMLKHIIQDNK